MIREFALPATPKAARKLVRASNITNLVLDEAIMEMAAQDCLTEEDVSRCGAHPRDRDVIQQIVDCDFRSFVNIPSSSKVRAVAIMVAAAELGQVNGMIVFTSQSRVWNSHCDRIGYNRLTLAEQNRAEDPDFSKIVDENRNKILVLESSVVFNAAEDRSSLWMDFPKTTILRSRFPDPANRLITTDDETLIQWWVQRLFPTAPCELLSSTPESFKARAKLKSRGYTVNKAQDLYPLFNIILSG